MEEERILKPEQLPQKRELPKKPSLLQKIIIRIFVLLLILIIAATALFFWWYFREKAKPPLPPQQPTQPQETIPLPPSPPLFVITQASTTIEASSSQEIPSALEDFLRKQEIKEGDFLQLQVKNLEANKEIKLDEFLTALEMNSLKDLSLCFEEKFSLFVYSQPTGKRLGFAITLKNKEEIEELMKSWEDNAQQDFQKFFLLMEHKGSAMNPVFRDAVYKTKHFRYLTYSRKDLGICYLISEDFLIFTSSYESMKKIIEYLNEQQINE